ncbi:MAG TPA: DnaJ domain-containing protein [bacterium]|nr:DnaJ domain-containing protein [bacterium]
MRFRPEIDYYEILQVHPRASQDMVKKAYRTLMGEMGAHPDLGGDEERAKLINEAYAVLGDPDLRGAYDRARARGASQGGGATRAPAQGRGPGDLDRATDFLRKLVMSIAVVAAAMMLARLLENPILSLADLAAMVGVLLRIWGQVAILGGR